MEPLCLKAVRLEYQLSAGEGEAAVGEGYCHYDPVSIGGASDFCYINRKLWLWHSRALHNSGVTNITTVKAPRFLTIV